MSNIKLTTNKDGITTSYDCVSIELEPLHNTPNAERLIVQGSARTTQGEIVFFDNRREAVTVTRNERVEHFNQIKCEKCGCTLQGVNDAEVEIGNDIALLCPQCFESIEALAYDAFDDSVYKIQTALGVEYGDNASVFFCSKDEQILSILREYILFEMKWKGFEQAK